MRTRRIVLTWLAVLCVPAWHARGHEPSAHVRALDRCAASVMTEGLARSATIRVLGDRLARSDIVAYVQCVQMRAGSPNGSLVWISWTPARRYVLLRIAINLPPERRVQILGHEMQHAVEVAEAPWVRGEADIFRLFEQIGHRTSAFATYETFAAKDKETAVRRDLSSPPPPPLPAGTVLADASRPASSLLAWSAPVPGGGLAPANREEDELRNGIRVTLEDRAAAPKALGTLTRAPAGTTPPRPGPRIKD